MMYSINDLISLLTFIELASYFINLAQKLIVGLLRCFFLPIRRQLWQLFVFSICVVIIKGHLAFIYLRASYPLFYFFWYWKKLIWIIVFLKLCVFTVILKRKNSRSLIGYLIAAYDMTLFAVVFLRNILCWARLR